MKNNYERLRIVLIIFIDKNNELDKIKIEIQVLILNYHD